MSGEPFGSSGVDRADEVDDLRGLQELQGDHVFQLRPITQWFCGAPADPLRDIVWVYHSTMYSRSRSRSRRTRASGTYDSARPGPMDQGIAVRPAPTPIC